MRRVFASCALLAAALGVSACGQPTAALPVVNGIPCDTAERVAFHIHAHLAIFSAGQPVQVPYGIGIAKPWQIASSPEGPFVASGSCFYWLHTHTQDGVIHIESPIQRTYTLGDFFAIWGQPLSANQVASVQGTVIAYLNGERTNQDLAQIPLDAHALVQLDVNDTTPPQDFSFPPGL